MIPILIQSLDMFFNFVRFLLIARIILSWVALARGGGGGPITNIVFSLTEPFLAPIRSIISRSPLGGPGMMIDFSVLIVFLLLPVVRNLIVSVLIGLM
ncbi:MAG: YggT family protein [Defluviitaleaceae bacterium]|nr:YggT family protein [Defluviitaleaceae bacterium]